MIRDGDILSFGKTELRAIHAPGHSIGHTMFWQEETGILFAADIDLSRFGPWYENPGSDIEQTIASIQAAIDLKPRVFISSHLPEVVTEDIEARLLVYLDIIRQRDELLIERMMVEKHLERLGKMGFIKTEENWITKINCRF